VSHLPHGDNSETVGSHPTGEFERERSQASSNQISRSTDKTWWMPQAAELGREVSRDSADHS